MFASWLADGTPYDYEYIKANLLDQDGNEITDQDLLHLYSTFADRLEFYQRKDGDEWLVEIVSQNKPGAAWHCVLQNPMPESLFTSREYYTAFKPGSFGYIFYKDLVRRVRVDSVSVSHCGRPDGLPLVIYSVELGPNTGQMIEVEKQDLYSSIEQLQRCLLNNCENPAWGLE